jgi:hypothetical protein
VRRRLRLCARRRLSECRGVTHVFSALTPVRPGHVSPLGRELRAFGPAEKSPLSQLRYLQLGRWVVVDQLKSDWPGRPRRMPSLNSAYLLFTATVTVPETDARYRFPEALLEDMRTHMAATADRVWSHCWGYPGTMAPDDFAQYFIDSRLRTGIHHFDYADAPVDCIRRALAVQERLTQFALEHQGLDGAKLKAAYLRESRSWPR